MTSRSRPSSLPHSGLWDPAQCLREYYDRRAVAYERIYERDDPVRRQEQSAIAKAMRTFLLDRRVLEVACGTGYWTQAFAEVADQVVATDVSVNMLAVAAERTGLPGNVTFRAADAFALDRIEGTFDAGVANFWLSHVPKARLGEFLEGFHRRLETRAAVFMADNVHIPGLGGELVSPPGTEDTHKLRTLSDGSQHTIIKNYYDRDELHDLLSPWAEQLHIHVGRCFWWAWYEIAGARA